MPSDNFAFGDVVLVPFPFTDQSAAKRRLAVVISSAAYSSRRGDVIMMAVTSQLRPSGSYGDIQVEQWQQAGLLKPSAVKPVIATLATALVLRKMGEFVRSDSDALRDMLKELVG